MNITSKLLFAAIVIAAATTSALVAGSAVSDDETTTASISRASSVSRNKEATTASSDQTTSSLTVINGNSGGNYAAGTQVIVSADAPKAGAKFARWTGDVAILANPFLPTTTATIPSMAVTITATYTAPSPDSVPASNGSWAG